MNIKKGDIIFIAPNYLFFKIVRWWTKDKYGHVAIVVDIIEDHILIAEATAQGIDINDFIWRKQLKESFIVYRLKDQSESKIDRIISKTLTFVGQKYDFMALTNFVFNKPTFGERNRAYCSEMIYRILRGEKILDTSLNPEMISPKILRDKLKDIADIKYEWSYKKRLCTEVEKEYINT